MATSPAGIYARLLTLLEQLPPEQAAVTLTWAELERLRGTSLPASARFPGYWTGPLAASWEHLGFRARLDRNRWTITFSRARPAVDRTHGGAPLHGKYQPLRDALARLPAEQASVTLTFAELEALVGPLSASARTGTAVWIAALRRYGFTAQPHRRERSVTFTRRAAAVG